MNEHSSVKFAKYSVPTANSTSSNLFSIAELEFSSGLLLTAFTQKGMPDPVHWDIRVHVRAAASDERNRSAASSSNNSRTFEFVCYSQKNSARPLPWGGAEFFGLLLWPYISNTYLSAANFIDL